jgi:hypothetical protein
MFVAPEKRFSPRFYASVCDGLQGTISDRADTSGQFQHWAQRQLVGRNSIMLLVLLPDEHPMSASKLSAQSTGPGRRRETVPLAKRPGGRKLAVATSFSGISARLFSCFGTVRSEVQILSPQLTEVLPNPELRKHVIVRVCGAEAGPKTLPVTLPAGWGLLDHSLLGHRPRAAQCHWHTWSQFADTV